MFIHLQQYTIKIAKIFCFVYILLNFFPSCATLPLRSRISASMWCVCVRWVFFLCAPRIASIDSQLCKLLLWTESKSFRRWNTCRMSTGEKKHSHKAVDCVFVLFFTFFSTLFSVYIRKNIMYKSSNSNSNGRGKKREKNVARDVVFQAAGCSIHC